MKKKFHIGDLISVVTGHTASPNGIAGIYEILSHMTGESVFTTQIPRFMDECKPWLLRWFPQLEAVNVEELKAAYSTMEIHMAEVELKSAADEWEVRRQAYWASGRTDEARDAMHEAQRAQNDARDANHVAYKAATSAYLEKMSARYGEWFDVDQIPPDDHVKKDVVEELMEQHPGKVIHIDPADFSDEQ